MAKIYGELEKAQLENVAADPTLGVTGRAVINTTDGKVKVDDGTSVKAMVTEDGQATLTNKDYDGLTATNNSRLTVPKQNTAGLSALTNKEGTIAFDTDKNLLQVNDGSGWADVGGGGSASLFTVAQDDFEFDITGVSTSDAVNLAITHETTSPIAGAGSLKIAKAASNENAEYVTISSFTIDDDLQAQILTVRFTSTQTTNYVDEYLVPVAYDVENSNEIPIIPEGLLAGTGEFRGTFQTVVKGGGGSEGQYQIRLKVNTTTTTAWDVFIDRFDVSKNEAPTGLLPSRQYDQTEFTLTGDNSWSTSRAVGIPYKTRDGVWRLRFNISGGSSSTTQVTLTWTGITTIGFNQAFAVDSNASSTAMAGRAPGSNNQLELKASVTRTFWQCAGDIELASKPTWAVDESPVILGEGADTRIVACSANLSSDQSIGLSTVTIIDYDTIDFDTHGAASTSPNFSYTLPSTGKYVVKANAQMFFPSGSWDVGENAYISLYVDGSEHARLHSSEAPSSDNTGNHSENLVGTINYNGTKGEVLTIRAFQNADASGSITGAVRLTRFDIHKIQGPQQIAASEIVAGFANGNSGQTINNGTTTTVIFNTVIDDSHNTYNNSNGELTVPKSGSLAIGGAIRFGTSGSWEINEQAQAVLIINSVEKQVLCTDEFTGSDSFYNPQLEFSLPHYKVNKGDIVEIAVTQNSDASTTLNSSSSNIWYSWKIS